MAWVTATSLWAFNIVWSCVLSWYLSLPALIAVGGYWLLSLTLQFFPLIVHTRKNAVDVVHSSHRGGAAERPENTLAAFRNAVACGSQLLELDVHLTKDKQIVVSHDQSLLRCSGVDKNISDVNYADLPPLKSEFYLPPPFHPSYVPVKINWEEVQYEPTTEDLRMPLLQEVLEEFPNTLINIDLKHDHPDLPRLCEKLLCETDRTETVVWGSTRESTCLECYKLNPTVPLLCSIMRAVVVWIAFVFGLLPFMPLRFSYYELPLVVPGWYNNAIEVFGQNWKAHAFLKTCNFFSSSRLLNRHLQARGICVLFWTINTVEDMNLAFSTTGCNGVMTDYPTRLTEYLRTNLQEPWSRNFVGKMHRERSDSPLTA